MHQMAHIHLWNYNWLIEFDSISNGTKMTKIFIFNSKRNSIPGASQRAIKNSSRVRFIRLHNSIYAQFNHASECTVCSVHRVHCSMCALFSVLVLDRKYFMRPPTYATADVSCQWLARPNRNRREREKVYNENKVVRHSGHWTRSSARANKLLSIRFNIGFDGHSVRLCLCVRCAMCVAAPRRAVLCVCVWS